MRPTRDETYEPCGGPCGVSTGVSTGVEHRIDRRHVGKMRATQVRVVQQDQVIRLPVEPPDDIRHGVCHATEVHRNVRRLTKQSAVRIKHRTGVIESILDVRRECRASQHHPHLVAHGLHATLKQRQFDTVDA